MKDFKQNQQMDNFRSSNASTNITNKKDDSAAPAQLTSQLSNNNSPKVPAKKKYDKKTNSMKTTTDENAKDECGITAKLRVAIDKKYEVIEVVGHGSYGCVSQGKCKKTGRLVAMKIMRNQATMEYEIIKLLRELQIMRRLNIVSD